MKTILTILAIIGGVSYFLYLIFGSSIAITKANINNNIQKKAIECNSLIQNKKEYDQCTEELNKLMNLVK